MELPYYERLIVYKFMWQAIREDHEKKYKSVMNEIIKWAPFRLHSSFHILHKYSDKLINYGESRMIITVLKYVNYNPSNKRVF